MKRNMHLRVGNRCACRVAMIVVLSLAGCSGEPSNRVATADSGPPPVPVQVATAHVTDLRPELALVGTLVAIPERTAVISSQVGGWVERLAVVEGETVKAGQLLVQLDDRAARIDLARAEAVVAEKASALKRLQRGYLPQEIEAARQDRDKARATVEGLRGELAALDELLKRREISSVAYETKAKALAAAEAALASADAHLKLLEQGTVVELVDEAQALLDAAQADRDRMKLALEWCSVSSPIDGVVVQLQARQGQFFDRAVPLAMVIDLSRLFVQLRIPGGKFSDVPLDTPVDIQVDALPGQRFQGRVSRISGQADPLTGNIVIFATVENKDHVLRPGLGCRARVLLPEIPNALVIPVAAVADHSGTPVVTVIRDGKAYEQVVELGAETDQWVQITHGLSAGDVVATAGGYGLPDGCPVRPVDDLAAAEEASQ